LKKVPSGEVKSPVAGSASCGQRVRRETLEQARREVSHKVLTKNKTSTKTRDEEIADIEKQIASGAYSAVALPGMRKRLAALKAVAFRDDRSGKKRVNATETSTPSPKNTPSQKVRPTAATNALNSSKAGENRMSTSPNRATAKPIRSELICMESELACIEREQAYAEPKPMPMGSDDIWWPEPARPPPRVGRILSASGAVVAPFTKNLSTES